MHNKLTNCLLNDKIDCIQNKYNWMEIVNKERGIEMIRNRLIILSARGDIDAVRVLLDIGADVNRVDENGVSALQAASANGHREIVRLLLDAGADINHVNRDGISALQIASVYGHREIVRLLLDNGADVNHMDRNRVTALQIASANRRVREDRGLR